MSIRTSGQEEREREKEKKREFRRKLDSYLWIETEWFLKQSLTFNNDIQHM